MPTPFPLARAQAALNRATGYRRFTRCTFTRDGVSAVLEPTGGSLTQDARRRGRWDGRLAFTGSDFVPTRPGDLLTPFGTTVAVELGLELLDGTISTVPYGVYEVSAVQTEQSAGQLSTTVNLIDLSDRVDRYRFEQPFTLEGGIWTADAINWIVLNRTGINPRIPYTLDIVLSPQTYGLETNTGPWEEVLDTVASFSQTAWYNRVGGITLGSIEPDVNSSYPLTTLGSLAADFDSRPANVVVARGESQDNTPAVQAVAMDTDPGSPTYAGTGPGTSPYGRTTEFFASPLIKTVAQAQLAANTKLRGNVGAGATYTLTCPYDPTIDAGDVISLRGTTFAVDSITLDLTGDCAMKVRVLT